jgi:hypothetical protein
MSGTKTEGIRIARIELQPQVPTNCAKVRATTNGKSEKENIAYFSVGICNVAISVQYDIGS